MLSGAVALAHQLLWTHRMVDVVGATPAATTRVLGAFFLGLSLGAALARPLGRRSRRPWRTLAAVEAGTAVLAVPLLTLPWWSARLWPAFGVERLAGWPGAAACAVLSLLLVVPPATLMGTTLPLLGRAILGGPRRLGREGTWLYALNTAGGVLGIAVATALAVRGVGVTAAIGAAAVGNVVLACLAVAADRGARPSAVDAETRRERRRGPAGPLVVAFLSGAGVLAGEALAIHLFDQVVSLAMLGAAVVLVAVILPLAVSAGVAAWLGARVVRVPATVGAALALAAATALATPLLFAWRTDGMRYLTLEFSADVPAFLARALALGLVAFAPFMLAAGLVLPLTFRWLERAADDAAGHRWGELLAVNGVGGLAGVELANRVLMPAFGMHLGFAVIGACYATASAALAWCAGGARGFRRAVALVGAAAAGVLIVPRLAALPLVRIDTWPGARESGSRLVDLATGVEGTVAAVEFGDDRVILLNNQYVLGGTGAAMQQQRMALLPAVLHPAPRRVAFIGVGTGITAGAALLDPAVEHVTAIDVSPLVVALARRDFGSLADDPRLDVVLADGRLAMAAARRRYDLVVGDLFMPWQVGTGRLYSVEHFHAVREALVPGGEFCQWLPMYQLTPEQFRVIVASFRDAFPTAYLFRDDRSPEMPSFGLVGFRDGALDWAVVERRTAVLRESGHTRDGFVAFPNLVRALYLGRTAGEPPADGIRNTLDDGWVERRAALDQIGRTWRYLDAGTQATLPEYLREFATDR